jgi:hypothetical protein
MQNTKVCPYHIAREMEQKGEAAEEAEKVALPSTQTLYTERKHTHCVLEIKSIFPLTLHLLGLVQ